MQPPPGQWQAPTSLEPFKPDRIIGILIMVLAGLEALCLSLLATVFAGFIGFAALPPAASANRPGEAVVAGAAVGLVVFMICGIAALQLASGYGVYRGQRWGFWLGIVLNAIALAGRGGASVLAIGVLVYCILRLAGSVGPKPN